MYGYGSNDYVLSSTEKDNNKAKKDRIAELNAKIRLIEVGFNALREVPDFEGMNYSHYESVLSSLALGIVTTKKKLEEIEAEK